MNKALYLAAISIICFAASPQRGRLTLDEALHRAMAKPTVTDLDLDIAQARIRMLEAASHWRAEWIPQLGLFSLTNPIAFGTNVGTRLLLRQSDVPPTALLEAKIAQVGAEIAKRRQSFQREVEVTGLFFELAESQRTAEQACAEADEAVVRREQVGQQLSLGRLTRADVLRHEQEILNREAECNQAEQRLQVAAAHLSTWVDIPPEALRVAEEHAGLLSLEYPLQRPEALIKVAFTYRKEPSRLRDAIDRLRNQVEAVRSPRMFQFSLGYARVGHEGYRGVNSTLFAGQGLQPEVSLRAPIKDRGAFRFEKQLLLLQLSRLERDLDGLETEMRGQITNNRAHFESRRGDLALARKRLALATELRKVVAKRYTAGLETLSGLASAEDAERHARFALARLEYESKTSLAVLLAILGSREQPVGRLDLIVAPEPALTSALN